MKRKSLISLVCVAVLSQYGLAPMTALATENDKTVTGTASSEDLKTNTILDELPLSSENTEETTVESEDATVESSEAVATTESTTEESTEVEETKTLNWEFKDPQQALVAGDDFAVKIKGTQAIAKLELPEGIEYDVEKNVEELRPLISFDKETRELTLTKIDEYEEIELVLTAEKAGEYELQLKNEVPEDMGDKLKFAVAEKVEESKEETKDSEKKEETTKEEKKKETKKQTRAGEDTRANLSITSDPASEINSASQRILYTTTISHTDSTKAINKGKIVITIENGKFKDFPKAADYSTLKSSTLSSDGKTITLELNDGFASGDFESYSYSAYSSVGVLENADVKVTNTFTGEFNGESDSFTNTEEKAVAVRASSVSPVVPGTTSWYLSHKTNSQTVYPGGKILPYYGLLNADQKEGFKNLRIKFHFSDKDKIRWFTQIKKAYSFHYQGGSVEYLNIDPSTIEVIDDETFIWNVGEINPIDISRLYPTYEMTAPYNATPGDHFTLDVTYMDDDTDILTGNYDFTVEADETVINFDSSYDEKKSQLQPGQNFLSSYTVDGRASKPVSDLSVTVDVPESTVPLSVINGNQVDTKTLRKVEYFDGTNWQEVSSNSDENFDLPNTAIKKLRIHYLEVKDKFTAYQPFRIKWQVKDSVASGTNFKLIHTVEYTDFAGVKQNPDVSAKDLSYEVVDNVASKESKTTVYQYNRTKDFNSGTVATGDTFRMNYRLGAEQGKVEQPYIFVKLPKGIKVETNSNMIQYPYRSDIGYNSAPKYGTTVTPISKANNTGSFEAADGSVVYYYKADDTTLTREDYLQMLFIDNTYTIDNMKSGVYEVEVGMGSLTENYNDVALNSGFATSALSSEMKTKLGSAATTYYTKKTKLTVGKSDKVTTSVAVKGSEDAAWLDSSKTGKVVPGKKVSYRVSIKNEGTEDYKNVQLVNILPYVGDNLVSSPTARGSQFQINPDSGGVTVKYNGGDASGVTLDYAMTNNPIRFSSPDGALIGTDPWTGSVSDFSQVRAIRVSAPFVTLKPGDEITMEYSGVVVLDAKRPVNPGDTFVANNSVAYRFQTTDGSIRAGEPAVTKVETVKAEKDGLVSGNVYIDLDKDGSKGGNDPGLNQVQFELFKKEGSNFVSTGFTSESSSNLAGEKGIFGFTDLEYGTYKVKVTLPSSKGAEFVTTGTDKVEKIDDTTAWVMKNGATEFKIDDLDISSGSNKVDDLSVPLFVHTPLNGTISFKNKDGNVVASDYGKGFKVELYKGSTQVAETTSKANGTFAFEDLTISNAGSYEVKITMPSGKTFVFTTDNSAGEISIDMEPGLGTTDPTDLYITDTDMPLASIALDNGRGTGKDVNPDSITLTASDKTTSISTDWKITKGGSTEYSGTSTDGSISLEDQINYLIGDKKAGDYTVEMTVTDFAGNQTTVSKNFSIKFGNVKYMSEGTEYAKEEDLLLYVDKLTKPATDPTKAGYVFDKWVKASDKSEWNFSTGPISEENLVLEATFKAAEQKIKFDVNGGDVSTTPADIEKDTGDTVDLSKVTEPTRTGYTFQHWYRQGDAGKTDVGASVVMPVGGMTLVADWEANSYKVLFDKNDGTGTMADQSFKYDTAQNLTANTFTREGYSFQGWSMSKGGAKKYDDKESVNNLIATNGGTVSLFAVWAATEQTITFDVNGGLESSKPAPIKGDTDSTIDLKDVKEPTRTGYTFNHWYKQGDAGKADVGNSVKMPAKGMTLVADWTANSYKVIFDKNEGTGTMVAQNFKYDTAQNLTANTFTREGYSFQGWSTTKTGSVEHTDGKSVKNLTADKDGSVTLYAIWKADSQVVQFDVNGGDITSKPANISGDTDSTVDLKDVKAPTRTGYTFKHWYKQGDAGKADVGNSVKMPAKGMTLVAEWEAISYSVKFHSNTGAGTMTEQSFKYDESKKLTKNSFTKAGYTFVGWSTAANAASAYTDEQSVSNLTDVKGDTVDLYALWSASAQVIQFDVNGGDVATKPGNISGDTDDTVDLSGVAAPTREGYSFKHWYIKGDAAKANVGSSVTMPAGGMILVADWEANTYKVKFNANGGTETMNDQDFVYDKGQALTENKFKRAGYTFAGWATTAAGTASYADKATVTNLTATDKEVVELFAVWTADNQTIQFDVNGGADSSKPADIVAGTDSNVDLSKVKAPTRKGYTFNHWYKKDDAAKTAVTGTITMPVGGMILVADWKANDYKVKFDANEGTGTMADQDFVYDTEQKLTVNAFDRTNYDFVGWSTTKTGKVEFADEEAVKNLTDEADGSKTLYAVWKIQERVITFDVNGGDGSTQPADIQKPIGENVDLDKVAAPTREGYSFAHWYKKDDAAKTAVTGTITMPDTNMVLVAAWNANHYKVKFDANGGTGTMKDQAFVYDTAQELTGNTFERKNYDFIGWATEKEGVVTYYDKDSVNNLTTKDSDTITLYAIWEKKAALPVIKANNIVMTTKQVDDYTKANTLERKIAELADAKVVDENTSDVIATHEKVSIDHSNVVSKAGVYKAHVSYETKARALVDPKEIDVTVIDPTTTQKITFDVNGGDEKTKPADISAKVGTTVSLKDVKAPTRSGYSFTGWYNGETKVGETVEMPENGMTLVAHWSQNGGGNGGNGSNGGSTGSGTTNTNVLARTGTTSTGKSLPQTNDAPTIGLSIVGGMLALLALFGFKKKKDEESETESK